MISNIMSPRVFVVTGSNKGIGKSIVKLLLQTEEEKIVYLTSRNMELGLKAVKELAGQGFYPRYHQLDITDKGSIQSLHDHLLKEHQGLDVLVNNAGIAYKGSSTAPFSEQADVTNKCNFFGTLDVCCTLFPILRSNGRVVHVSSFVSEMVFQKLSEQWRNRFSSPDLTIELLKRYINQFITDAFEDKLEQNGWPKSAYGMSKVGVSFMAKLHQIEMDKLGNGVIVNACCPGIVDTDMTGGRYANMITPDEGADTPTYLALLEDKTSIRGCFVKKRMVHSYPPHA